MFYKVQIMPEMKVLARHLSIEEAVAKMGEFNAAQRMLPGQPYAVIAECWGPTGARPQTSDAAQRANEILERAAAGYTAGGSNAIPEWQRSQRGW